MDEELYVIIDELSTSEELIFKITDIPVDQKPVKLGK
jgi:hypothetical protein